MIGSCVQSRTLTPSVAWSRCNERMRTAIGDVDILVCGIEPERWQTGIGAIDLEVWCSIWRVNIALLQISESFSQCIVHICKVRICCYGRSCSDQCKGLCIYHDDDVIIDARSSEN